MHTVTSFHASAVEPQQVGAIMAEYLALERARIYRRLFVTRFSLLAACLALIGFGFHWLSLVASWISVGLCVVAPLWAWVVELRCDRRLARSLEEIPGAAQRTVVSPL
jgi:Flp pilus assembly protein TadB